MKRTAFFISDGTGITAETLGQSLLAQFEAISFTKLTRPYIDSVDKARAMVQQINHAAEKDGARPIIFDTVVNQEIRRRPGPVRRLHDRHLFDLPGSAGRPNSSEHSSYSVGKSHSIASNSNYMERIEAVNFALDNDDGARTHYYDKADLILVGVSRCGKTPTCLYMAMQFGIRRQLSADRRRHGAPAATRRAQALQAQAVRPDFIDPDRLTAIRHERKPNSRYASYAQCGFEVRGWKTCSAARPAFHQLHPLLGGRDFRQDSGGERRRAPPQITFSRPGGRR